MHLGEGAVEPAVNPLVAGRGVAGSPGEGTGAGKGNIWGGLGAEPVWHLVGMCFSILTTCVTYQRPAAHQLCLWGGRDREGSWAAGNGFLNISTIQRGWQVTVPAWLSVPRSLAFT